MKNTFHISWQKSGNLRNDKSQYKPVFRKPKIERVKSVLNIHFWFCLANIIHFFPKQHRKDTVIFPKIGQYFHFCFICEHNLPSESPPIHTNGLDFPARHRSKNGWRGGWLPEK